jgi:hypothetical protein
MRGGRGKQMKGRRERLRMRGERGEQLKGRKESLKNERRERRTNERTQKKI